MTGHNPSEGDIVDESVDSGMSGEAVAMAELLWANLPTGKPWTSLATHEKALVCHQFARFTDEITRLRAEIERKDEALTFYAEQWAQDVHGWEGTIGEVEPTAELRRDAGYTARAALTPTETQP